MKLKIGDQVCHSKYGVGEIVAMSKEWCVYFSKLYQFEIALQWNEVSIPLEPDITSDGIQEIEMGKQESEDDNGFCGEENQVLDELPEESDLSDLQS